MTKDEFINKWREPIYVGDGIFIHFDGFHFILTTEREGGTHWVGLEPSVFDRVILYRKECYREYEEITNSQKAITE